MRRQALLALSESDVVTRRLLTVLLLYLVGLLTCGLEQVEAGLLSHMYMCVHMRTCMYIYMYACSRVEQVEADLLSMFAHELRNPLNGTVANLQFAQIALREMQACIHVTCTCTWYM